MGNYLLGLDLGTSSLKALVADMQGVPVADASRPLDYVQPEGDSSLAREFHPEKLWQSICHLVREALHQAGASAQQVVAVGITSQRQGAALLDSAGRELYLGPNLDLRAVLEGMAQDEARGQEIYQTTGHLPSFFFLPAKLRWFQAHRPDQYARIATVLPLADWVAYRLTGEVGAEVVLLGEAGLLDVSSRTPARSLLQALGLRSDLFPPMRRAGAEVGHIRADVAAATGLGSRTPVTVAGPDTQCGLLGLGVARPGEVGVVAGWSVTVQAVTARPTFDQRRRTWVGCFPLPDRWVAEANTGDSGNAYRWLKETCFGDKADGYEEMERQATDVPPGADGVLALLGPEPLDLSRPGVRPGGILFPVPLTYAGIGRGHLVRASLENIAFAVRGACELLEEVTHQRITRVALGGGMTRTRLFSQTQADVLGREVQVSPTPLVSTLGAALAAGVVAGGFGSLEEAALAARSRLTTVTPNPSVALDYEGHYQRWRRALEGLERMGL